MNANLQKGFNPKLAAAHLASRKREVKQLSITNQRLKLQKNY